MNLKLLLSTIACLSFFSLQVWAQPPNNSCETATQLTLGTPANCPSTTPVNNNFTGTNIGATASLPAFTYTGCGGDGQTDGAGAEVWYRFTATSSTITFSFLSGLSTPNVVIFAGTCGNLTAVGCTSAPAGAGTVTGQFTVAAGQVYYIRISGGDVADQGNFSFRITSFNICANCLTAYTFTSSPAPSGGSYEPGQSVQFCFSVRGWTTQNAEWFHSITLQPGSGWDLSTLAPVTIANSCSGAVGNFAFYNSWVGQTTGQTFGPGFAFDANSGGGSINGNPGDNWGDGSGGGCATITPANARTFCWSITVGDCSATDTDLSMGVRIHSDGEAGSYSNASCTSNSPTVSALATMACPNCPDLSEAPFIDIEDSFCTTGCMATGGNISAPPFACPLGSVLQYFPNASATTDGTFSPPLYDMSTPVQVYARCVCETDPTTVSPPFFGFTNPANCVAPTLAPLGPYCQADGTEFLDTNPQGVAGNWIGPGVNNNQFVPGSAGVGSHVLTFIADDTGCSGNITVVVEILVTPTLAPISALCESSDPITLLPVQGSTFITGTWIGPGVAGNEFNPFGLGAGEVLLSFIPDAGQCANPNAITVDILSDVIPTLTPIGPICQTGGTVSLPTTQDGLAGNWSGPGVSGNQLNPASLSGTITLTFTPNTTDCTSSNTLTVTINPAQNAPSLTPIGPFCQNSPAVPLPNTQDGITGQWSGTGVSGGQFNPALALGGATLTFTPDPGQCAVAATLGVTVNPLPTAFPNFLTACANTNGQGTFNLNSLNGEVSGGNGTVSWFSNAAATTSINNPGSYNAGQTTVYATVTVNGCISAPAPVSLFVTLAPIALPTTLSSCTGTFNLNDANNEVNANSGNAVSWFTNAAGTAAIANPAAYTVGSTTTVYAVVSDGDCNSAPVPVILQITAGLTINGTVQNVACNGAATGSITLSVGGGSGTLLYDWNINALDGQQNPAGLTAGTYSVTVTDSDGCTAMASFTVTQPAALSVVCSQQSPVTTIGGSNGSASIQISGGTAGYTLAWTGAGTGTQAQATPGAAIIPNLSAGNYNLNITDANGCTQMCTFIITEPGCNLTVSGTSMPALCNGGDEGSITLTVSNGTGTLNFNWNDNSLDGQQNPFGLSAGTYSVTVTDAAACTATTTVTVAQPNALAITCAQQSPVTTIGGSNGSASVQISGGTAGYTLAWTGTANGTQTQATAGTAIIPNLSAGSYTLNVTDANGCTQMCTFTITAPGCNLMVSGTSMPAVCNGGDEGSITLSVSNGSGTLTFDWNDNSLDGQQNPFGLSAGTYSVTVTDAAACTATTTVTVAQPNTLAITCAQQSPVTTVGGSNGSASVQISGGTAGYTLAWTGAASGMQAQGTAGTAIIPNLSAGNYNLLVTDANGCTSTCTFTISSPGCNLALSVANTAVSCNGGSNGSITLTVSNSTGALTFDWSDNSLDGQQNPSGLAAGTYNVVVTDGAGCTASISTTITQAAALAITCSQQSPVTTVGGTNGVAQISISGGTAGYTLAWTGPANGTQMQATAGNASITGLPAGSYNLLVTDANGCTQTCTFTILEPGCNLTVTPTSTPLSCNGANNGSIMLAVANSTGALTFDWDNNSLDGQQNPSGLAAGTYNVIVTDAAGCTATASVTVTQPASLTITCAQQSPVTTVGGNNGAAQISISGGTAGYTITWSGAASGSQMAAAAGNATVPNLVAGNYSLTVTDTNGCSEICSFTITDPSCNLTLTIANTPVSCNGGSDGSITLNTSDGIGTLDFDWNIDALDGQQNLTGLVSGTYSVVVTDGAGCTASASTTVAQPAALSIGCSEQSPATTVGGSDGVAQININGGTANYTLAWTGASNGMQTTDTQGSTLISGLPAGTYSLVVTDANGCITDCTFDIAEPICTISLDITGSDATCNGATDGSIALAINNSNGALLFDWDDDSLDGQQNPSGLAPGTYSVTVTDAQNCSAETSVTLTEPTALDIACSELSPATTVGGSNGTAQISISGGTAGYTITWSGAANGTGTQPIAGTFDITNLPAGNYTAMVTDANGCTRTCDFTITEPVCAISLDIVGVNVACNGGNNGSITLVVSGNIGTANFDWSDNGLDGQQDPSNLSAGTYSVTVTDAAGCSAEASVTLTEASALVLSCSEQSPVTTVGGSDGAAQIQISGGTAGYSLTWSGAGNGTLSVPAAGTVSIPALFAGDYTLTITDANGCTATCDFTITEPVCSMSLDLAGTNVSCDGSSDGSIALTVNNSTGALTFDWDDDSLDGQQNPSGLAPGAYSVTVTDAQACSAEGSLSITAPQALAISCAEQSPVTAVGGSNGAAQIDISGGTAGYTLSWSGPATGTQQANAAGSTSITGLPAGAYTLEVTDANGCTTTCDFTITEPICNITLVLNATDETCEGSNDGSIALGMQGGSGSYTLAWSDPNLGNTTNPTGLAPGAYSVIVTDNITACTATDSTTILPGAPIPTADFTAAPQSICLDQDLTLTYTGNASAGATYTWDFDGGTAAPGGNVAGPHSMTWATAGTKTPTLTVSENGCVSTPVEQSVTVVAPLVAPVVVCQSSTTSSVVFIWDAVPGATGYEVTGANGTLNGTTYTVTGLAPDTEVNISVVATGDAPCGNSPAGSASCAAQACQPVSISLSGTQAACIGGSATVTFNITAASTEPFLVTYSVDGGPDQEELFMNGQVLDFTNLQATTTVTVSNIVNSADPACSYPVNASFTITVNAPVSAGQALPAPTFCQGAGTPVSLNGLLSGASPGGIWTETSAQPSFGGAFNAATGTFNGNSQTAGTYRFTYTVTGTAPCPNDTEEVSIVINPLPQADAGTAQVLTCNMGTVSIGGNGTSTGQGITYAWDAPIGVTLANATSAIIETSQPGTYTLTVSNAFGCTASAPVVVTANQEVPTAQVSISNISCFQSSDGAIIVENISGGIPPYELSFNGGAFGTQTQFPQLSPSNYTLIIRDQNGCFSELEANLTQPDALTVTLVTNQEGNSSINFGDSIRLEALFNPGAQLDTVIWKPESTAEGTGAVLWVSPETTTQYSVTIIDINGCTASDNLTVNVARPRRVFVPDSFSPNGDGINDVFYIYGAGEAVEVKSFLIFNRWGEAMISVYNFPPNDPTFGWDGKYRGQEMNTGVYVYFAEIEFSDGQIILFKGEVLLMK